MDVDEYRRMAEYGKSHWWYRSTRSLLRQLLEPHLDTGAGALYLDAAGGTGATGGWLAEIAPTVLSDVDTFAIGMGRNDFPGYLPVLADLNDLPFRNGAFDATLCVTALCHRMNPDPSAIVAEFARITKPGGVVCILEPGGRRLRRGHDDVTHTGRRFSVGDLRQMAESAGLDIIRSTGAYSFLLPPAAAMTVVKRLRQPAESASDVGRNQSGLGGVLGTFAAAERRLLRHVSLPVGLSAIVLARNGKLRSDL